MKKCGHYARTHVVCAWCQTCVRVRKCDINHLPALPHPSTSEMPQSGGVGEATRRRAINPQQHKHTNATSSCVADGSAAFWRLKRRPRTRAFSTQLNPPSVGCAAVASSHDETASRYAVARCSCTMNKFFGKDNTRRTANTNTPHSHAREHSRTHSDAHPRTHSKQKNRVRAPRNARTVRAVRLKSEIKQCHHRRRRHSRVCVCTHAHTRPASVCAECASARLQAGVSDDDP